MKFCLGLLIAMSLFITACKKDHEDNSFNPNKDYGCIERIYSNKDDHMINSADVATVNKLFADNNIDYSNFRYIWYSRIDSIQVQVRVQEYAKGMPILMSNSIFYFKKGIFSYDVRTPVDVAGLDTVPHTQLQYLKWMFLNDIQNDKMRVYGNYKDSCLNAELGFWQLAGDGNTAGKAVKAWLVKGKAFYPIGIYKDEDGSQIAYSNGIFLY